MQAQSKKKKRKYCHQLIICVIEHLKNVRFYRNKEVKNDCEESSRKSSYSTHHICFKTFKKDLCRYHYNTNDTPENVAHEYYQRMIADL